MRGLILHDHVLMALSKSWYAEDSKYVRAREQNFSYRKNILLRYDEVCGYDFNSGPDGATVTGHFTQVVWKGSTKLGIGRAEKDIVYQGFNLRCGYIVGRYKPAGNVIKGEYTNNVLDGEYNPSYCSTVSTKRKKYFDENGKPVIIVNDPFTEVDVPEVRKGTSAHAPLCEHQHIAKPLHSKTKKSSHGLNHQ